MCQNDSLSKVENESLKNDCELEQSDLILLEDLKLIDNKLDNDIKFKSKIEEIPLIKKCLNKSNEKQEPQLDMAHQFSFNPFQKSELLNKDLKENYINKMEFGSNNKFHESIKTPLSGMLPNEISKLKVEVNDCFPSFLDEYDYI